MVDQIVLTALDGTLLNSSEVGAPEERSNENSDDRYEQLRSLLEQLREKGIPVILFSRRDRTEIDSIRQQLGLVDPFIAESGSAVFTPVDHNPFEPSLGEKEDNYFVLTLGCPYVQARAGLRVLANIISHPLKGFGDFTVPQLQKLAGISEQAAHQAKAREFSELFMTPKAVDSAELQQAAEDMGFEVVLRSKEETRFSELLGSGASLATAASAVGEAYLTQLEPGKSLSVTVISSRSDNLAALSQVKSDLDIATWREVLTDAPAPDGWLNAVAPLLGT